MSSADEIANSEIILWALSELGGNAEVLDVEEIFLKSFQLAPKRFSWRTRPDLPDYKKMSKALQEAEAKWPTFFVKTADGLGRQLAVDGQRWVKNNANRRHGLLAGDIPIQEPRQRPRSRMLAEVEKSAVFALWQANDSIPNEKWRVAELLRCSPDSATRIWRERLESLRAAANAAEREQLLAFLDQLANEHSEWFGGAIE